MLSPVQESDTIAFPCSPPPSTNDTPKHTFKNLNNELTKINSRKDSAVSSPYDSITPMEPPTEQQVTAPHPEIPNKSDHFEANAEKSAGKSPEKIRRISRFKVSVVTEPDPSKLIIKPEPKKHPDDSTSPTQQLHPAKATTNTGYVDLKQVPSLQDIPSSETIKPNEIIGNDLKLHDSVTLINNTMHQLQENIQTSYLSQGLNIPAKKTIQNDWLHLFYFS